MKHLSNYPQDIIDHLRTWEVDLPNNEVLSDILTKSLWASFEKEEGNYATFALQLRDRNDVPRHQSFIFSSCEEFTVPILAKLASAVDHRQSSLGIASKMAN